MITLEQFERTVRKDDKGNKLYAITSDLDIVRLTPYSYTANGEDRFNIFYTIKFWGLGDFSAKDCFATEGEAKAELKKRLAKKLEELK